MTNGTGHPPRKRGRPRRSQATNFATSAETIDISRISGALGPRIGAKLRQARTLRGLTQQDLAQDTFSKSYVSAIEHGKIKPSLRALVYLAERLSVPVAYFLNEQRGEDELAAAFASLSPAAISIAEFKLTQAEHQIGEHSAAALELLSALDVATLSSTQRLRHALLIVRANVALNDTLATQIALQQANELAVRLGDAETGYRLRLLAGANEAQAGKNQAAVQSYRELIPAIASGAIKDPSLQLAVYTGLGNTLRKLGRDDEAAAAYKSALAAAQLGDSVDQLSTSLWQLSESYGQAGHLDQALSYATRSVALRDASDNICHVIDIYTNLAEISQQAGDWAAARAHFEAALIVAEQLRNDHSCAEVLHSLARLMFRHEQLTDDLLKQAADYANRALDKARHTDEGALLGKALVVVGMVQNAQGQADASDKSYADAFAQLKQAKSDATLGDAYFEYAQILRKRGDNLRAGDYLQQAYLLRQS